MTAPAATVGPDTPRSEAARRMAGLGVNRLPVLDGGRLCGIVSRGDVVRSCRGSAGRSPGMKFFEKMRGDGVSPPGVGRAEILWSFLGALGGIAAVAWLHESVADPAGLTLLLGSFGASAVRLYGAPKSPLAQPRNLVGGHVLSALVGVTVRLALPSPGWLCCALAVATAIALMHATRTLHPPGGATALIAVTGGPKIVALGYLYALVPALSGALVMLAVALVANNLAPARRYPHSWR